MRRDELLGVRDNLSRPLSAPLQRYAVMLTGVPIMNLLANRPAIGAVDTWVIPS